MFSSLDAPRDFRASPPPNFLAVGAPRIGANSMGAIAPAAKKLGSRDVIGHVTI